MNELINGNAIKMTSIEIAELVGKRHDNVKRTIETLAKNGVIRLPQIEVSERINNLGFNVQYEHYVFEGEQGKRDSIVVVAQLSPEFTARLVDRWRELEEAAVNIPKTIPELLIQTRGNQTEVARMLSCARGTVLKYNRDSKGERHVIVNGVLMVKQGKRGRR
ncbi:Rha family transcriptional regulator [Escherichia coli]|nr:Rha family transcriptional regulator [Escherichia coli]